jgi:DNA-binding beta-propeller fold protein YncE
MKPSTSRILLTAAVGLLLVTQARAAAPEYKVTMQPLPHEGATSIGMDYIAFDPSTGFVWAPAGNTAVVDVIDPAAGTVKQVTGFKTAEMGTGDRKRTVGPSSATVGAGTVYIGNRGDSSVCAFDAKSFARGVCHQFDSMPDGILYIPATKEVWVTTPRDKSIRVCDAATLAEKTKLTYDGNPEGFAVDGKRGRFYTNLEDKDRTLAIDLRSHKTVATWEPACGKDGPHGLRVDEKSGYLFVACSARAEVLDAGHDGAVLSSIDTGDGVDDIDYAPASHLLYVGAARVGQLVISSVDGHGKLSLYAKVPTHDGARNPAVTSNGTVYLAHSGFGNLTDLVVASPQK